MVQVPICIPALYLELNRPSAPRAFANAASTSKRVSDHPKHVYAAFVISTPFLKDIQLWSWIMAPRRVIADSDDEDDDFSPIKPAAVLEPRIQDAQPEMEPLSPQHQPASPIVQRQHSVPPAANAQDDTSESTSPSFFANVYDEHQGKALQQSRLVENIVRQSQKASRSSGDVSLPAQGQGRGRKAIIDESSTATNVTSPAPRAKLGPRKSQLAQMSDATELTTPKKSSEKDEWDIPSSGDEAKPSSKKSARSSGPIAADSPKIYVAQSNLSASQKRQYKKVQVPDSHPGDTAIPDSLGQMQPPSNHKSSCATTVAVSTPSRYASSGPRPPWEIEQPVEASKANTSIDLTLSSPDAITVGGGIQEEEEQSPVRRSSVKRKRPVVRDDDDELGLDGTFSDHQSSDVDSDYDRAGRKPAKKAKQPAKAASAAPAAKEPKKRGRKKKQPASEDIILDDEFQISEPSTVTAPVLPETQATDEKPKRKRGRPRKSDVPQQAEVQIEPPADEGQPADVPTEHEAESEKAPAGKGAKAAKRDKTQRVVETSTEDDETTQVKKDDDNKANRSVSPLKETDRNALGRSQSTISDSDKSISKSATPSQAGKMSYRVGLSKKSRIAPLLKMIRK